LLLLIGSTAALASYILIVALRPFLARYALAQPNARSSHRIPTPQGGGIAIIAAIVAIVGGIFLAAPELLNDPRQLTIVFGAVTLLALVGATDDVCPLGAMPRLILQFTAAAVAVMAIPEHLRLVPLLPWWIERVCIVIGVVWVINVVNFMDGIDWMTVAEVVPLTAGLTFFGLIGELPRDAAIVAAALFGATIGFAPFNRPIARLFLGDVGSLPIGLLLTWMLVLLAANGHFAAALLMPLYYLADATITLLQRIAKRKPIAEAHRDHFYQRAVDGSCSVYRIVGSVFSVNAVLVALAMASILHTSVAYQLTLFAFGSALVGALLWTLDTAKHRD